jgi:hypothetical protein
MDIKELVREEAAKTYTDAVELAAFMEGFEKQAELHKEALFGSASRFAERFATGFGTKVPGVLAQAGVGLGVGLATAGIVAGINAGASALNNNGLKSKFEAALQYVLNTNKIVKGGKPDKVRSYAQTLFSFAPHVASDQNLLSTLLANAVLGEGIDPMTIKSVTDLEGRYKENNAYGPLHGIRT